MDFVAVPSTWYSTPLFLCATVIHLFIYLVLVFAFDSKRGRGIYSPRSMFAFPVSSTSLMRSAGRASTALVCGRLHRVLVVFAPFVSFHLGSSRFALIPRSLHWRAPSCLLLSFSSSLARILDDGQLLDFADFAESDVVRSLHFVAATRRLLLYPFSRFFVAGRLVLRLLHSCVPSILAISAICSLRVACSRNQQGWVSPFPFLRISSSFRRISSSDVPCTRRRVSSSRTRG